MFAAMDDQQFEFNGVTIRWRTPSAPEHLAEDFYKALAKPIPIETDMTPVGFPSDRRIKNIEGRSDGAADLATLSRIEITDYTFKDVIASGNRPHKRVIAQQVEKVYPQAVSQSTAAVPDIYRQGPFVDGWVELATDLKIGERVRLIADKAEGVYEVLEVTEDKFRTDFKPEGDKVFVFGREVDDFRTVDYDAIFMLNVSATQQIKKEKDEEVRVLRAEITDLKSANDALQERLQLLESKFETAPGVVVAKSGSNENGARG